MKEKQNVKLDTVANTHNPTTWKAEEESQIQKDKTITKHNKKTPKGVGGMAQCVKVLAKSLRAQV